MSYAAAGLLRLEDWDAKRHSATDTRFGHFRSKHTDLWRSVFQNRSLLDRDQKGILDPKVVYLLQCKHMRNCDWL